MTSRGTIVKNIKGQRYLLTSRRIVELDSSSAQAGEPWSAANKDIRKAAELLPHGDIKVTSVNMNDYGGARSVTVSFGKISEGVIRYCHPAWRGKYRGKYRIGCGMFDFKTFKKILRNAGVKGTQKKAFAAKAGA